MINDRRLREHLAIVAVSKKILKCTCQFYNFKEGTKEFPVPNGCGILVSHNGKYYCLSNAHVLADRNLCETFVLMGGGKTMSIGGQYYFTSIPDSGRRADDTIDVTVVQLSDVCIEGLIKREYQFLNSSRMLTGHQLRAEENVMVVGYPASQTKINTDNKKVIAKPFLFRTRPSLKDLAEINFPSNLHHIAKYSIPNLFDTKTGKRKRGPKPHGISGSGLWLLQKTMMGFYEPYLIGIFAEYLENRALLLSTKIDLFIDVIRQKCDATIVNNGVKVELVNENIKK